MQTTFPAYFAISLHFTHKNLKIKYVLVLQCYLLL